MNVSDVVLDSILSVILSKHHSNIHQCRHLESPYFTNQTIQKESITSCDPDHCRIIVLSDTHSRHQGLGNIPSCDIFVHCGDILMVNQHSSLKSTIKKLVKFNEWLGQVPSKFRIVIGGNHDFHLEALGKAKVQAILSNCTYLVNESTCCEQFTIFGSPTSVGTSQNKAFQSRSFLEEALSSSPDKVDILITHGQCTELEHKIQHKIHIFGHNHNSYGVRFPGEKLHGQEIRSLSVCAPIMNGNFKLSHLPIVIDIPRDPGRIVIPLSLDTMSFHNDNLLSKPHTNKVGLKFYSLKRFFKRRKAGQVVPV